MEALRAAVATVAQYDEWDLALQYITFGLNTHISTTTKLSPLEFAHWFPEGGGQDTFRALFLWVGSLWSVLPSTRRVRRLAKATCRRD